MKNIFLSVCALMLVANSPCFGAVMEDLAKKLGADSFAKASIPEEPSFHFFSTPNRSWLIGMRQVFLVHAKPERVALVLDSVKEYTGIFSGVKKAEFTEFKSINEYSVFTETQVDFPFVPNDQTELSYHIDRSSGKVLYRYALKKSNSVNQFDGVIFLLATKEGDTIYFEYDSFEPDLGIAKMAGEQKIWVESALGNFQSDWAVKLRAEHGDWPASRVLELSQDKLSGGRRALKKLFDQKTAEDLKAILYLSH